MSNKSQEHALEQRPNNSPEDTVDTSEFSIEAEFSVALWLFWIAFILVALSLLLYVLGHPSASMISSSGVATGFLGNVVARLSVSTLSIQFTFR
jgi:hypothetical protein